MKSFLYQQPMCNTHVPENINFVSLLYIDIMLQPGQKLSTVVIPLIRSTNSGNDSIKCFFVWVT